MCSQSGELAGSDAIVGGQKSWRINESWYSESAAHAWLGWIMNPLDAQTAGGRARLRCRLLMSGYWMVVLVLSLITSARVSGALRRPLRRAGVETRLNALSCLIGLAQQGARANVHIGHASCCLKHFETKHRTGKRSEARVAPAVAVAHL